MTTGFDRFSEEVKKLGLNKNQVAIAFHTARGLPNVTVAKEVQKTEKQVKSVLTRIYKKLSVKNRVELIIKFGHYLEYGDTAHVREKH